MATDDDLTAFRAAAPRAPVDPELFSSNTRFGEPGTSPQGRPTVPDRFGVVPIREPPIR